jgi:hypothetical protein
LGISEVPLESGIANEYCFVSRCAAVIDVSEAEAAASWGRHVLRQATMGNARR